MGNYVGGKFLRRIAPAAMLAGALFGLGGLAGNVEAATLGPATGYGAFIFENFSGQFSDVQLNLAVGGNASLNGYSVGNNTTPASAARLVVGGNLSVGGSGGQVGAGGAGSIFAGGSITGSLTAASVQSGLGGALPVNFGQARNYLENTANSLGGLAANGSASNAFGTLTLNGGDSKLNIFTIDSLIWNAANTVNITTPVGSSNLINITGTSVVFQNGQISINGTSGENNPANARTLYNLVDATALSLPGSKAPQGTVLAAFADVSGGFGQLNGELIAKSFTGSTQINRPGFDGDPHLTPVPAALPLLASALGGLAFVRTRRS